MGLFRREQPLPRRPPQPPPSKAPPTGSFAGGIAPAGLVVLLVAKTITGGVTPSGALTSSKVILRTLTGAMTPSGSLKVVANKALGGAQTPHGALTKVVQKRVTGALTPAGFESHPSASPFPVTVAANGRYLVDAHGNPFVMIGDACQSGAASPTAADFQSYIDTRVGQGFNTININFVEHVYAPSAPADRNGNFPFATQVGGGSYTSSSQNPAWLSWNDTYFHGLELKVAYAQSKGVLVSLAFYMGGGAQDGSHHTEGWYGELAAETLAHASALGAYLANGHGPFTGFKNYNNVIWTWGADLFFTTDTSTRDKLKAVAQGVRDNAPSHLFAGDWGIPGTGQGLSTTQTEFRLLSDLQAVYAYTNNGNIVTTSRNGFAYDPSVASSDGRALTALPTYMKETGYEGESNPSGTPVSVRAFGWAAILNGCNAGYWYGHRDVFNFAHPSGGGYGGAGLFPPYSDWDTSINSTGAQDMARLATFIKSVAHHELVPSAVAAPFVGKLIVTGGNDSSAGGTVNAAATRSGKLCLCYTPSTNFTVDMTVMAGTSQARWWDPTNGSFTTIGNFANTGTHAFTTPGTNSAGQNDFLLVLSVPEAVTGGTLAPTGTLTKRVSKSFAGSITPAASVQRANARTTAGMLTPSGALIKRVGRTLAGAVTSSGAMARLVAKPVAGAATPTGALAKRVTKVPFAGAATPTGQLFRAVPKALAGAVTSVGTMVKTIGKFFAGFLAPSGGPTGPTLVSLGGSEMPTGSLSKRVVKALGGVEHPTGALSTTKVRLLTLGGALTPAGATDHRGQLVRGGEVTPSGVVGRAIGKVLGGALVPHGSVLASRTFFIAIGGGATPAGNYATTNLIIVLPVADISIAGSTLTSAGGEDDDEFTTRTS